jgi:conjugal transfer pilus assembly protein TraW
VLLPDGKLLYKAGTTVNPFDHMHLEKKLIFIDGRDEEQVEWFKGQRRIEQIKEEDKLILVAGRPFDLEKELDREVYFDQSGSLVQKFKIEQVPAIVEQEEKVLRIREIVVN